MYKFVNQSFFTQAKQIILSFFCILFWMSSTYGREKITIQDAIDIALKNNIQVKEAMLNQILTEQSLKQAKYALWPTISANSSANYTFGRSQDPVSGNYTHKPIASASEQLSGQVYLFAGHQLINQIAQAKYQLESDKSNARKAQNDLTLNVITSYLKILSNQDMLTAARQQLQFTKQQLEQVQKLFNAGNNTVADLAQAKSQIANAELNLTNAENQLDLSYLDLAQLMERDPDAKFEVVEPIMDPVDKIKTKYSPEEVFNESVNTYPDVKAAEYSRLASSKAVTTAKGKLYPTITLSYQLGTNFYSTYFTPLTNNISGYALSGYTATNNPVLTPVYANKIVPFLDQKLQNATSVVGINISFPIFGGQGGGYQSRIDLKKAKINLQGAELAEILQRNNLDKAIRQAIADLKAAEKKYYSSLSAFVAADEAYTIAKKRHAAGLLSTIEFIQSQTERNQAEFNMIQTKYDFIFRGKVIDFYIGNPITFG